jgi:hypothetical protein
MSSEELRRKQQKEMEASNAKKVVKQAMQGKPIREQAERNKNHLKAKAEAEEKAEAEAVQALKMLREQPPRAPSQQQQPPITPLHPRPKLQLHPIPQPTGELYQQRLQELKEIYGEPGARSTQAGASSDPGSSRPPSRTPQQGRSQQPGQSPQQSWSQHSRQQVKLKREGDRSQSRSETQLQPQIKVARQRPQPTQVALAESQRGHPTTATAQPRAGIEVEIQKLESALTTERNSVNLNKIERLVQLYKIRDRQDRKTAAVA